MDLNEYMRRIISSAPTSWTTIFCGAHGGGPSYRDQFSVWSDGSQKFAGLDLQSHSVVASFRGDLSISLAWGLEDNPDFSEGWTRKFPNTQAPSSFLDFFYNGALVWREELIAVDGGRCYLPLPALPADGEADGVNGIGLPRGKSDVIRLVNSLTSIYDYDQYLEKAGLQVTDEPWPA